MQEDVLTLDGDPQKGEPLLRPVMRAGRRLAPPEPLATARNRAAAELAALPERLRRLEETASYPVHVSSALRALTAALDAGET
jgi:nicotinate phosphoribosyltransferase